MSSFANDAAEVARCRDAAAFLSAQLGEDVLGDVRLGMVLGSGLKGFAKKLDEARSIAFADVPEWPKPRVEGHGGALVMGRVDGVSVVCLTGRVHLYEGYSPGEVTRAVRTLRLLGVPRFLLTNAAGGMGDSLSAGDLMAITDHLNLTGGTPLFGPGHQDFGPRFPDQSNVYSAELTERLCSSDAPLQRGVYAGLLGPSYETPAEVRMLRALGADAVGMSTVHEATALHAMGAQVCGMSLISNLAAGISERPLSHDEVVEAGREAEATMQQVVTSFCRGFA
ncbi:MAG: purine-nucleoside phosphorylase [Planctomycetota bacterium]